MKMFGSQLKKRKKVFSETEKLCQDNVMLKTCIQASTVRQYVLTEDTTITKTGKEKEYENPAILCATLDTALHAAQKYKKRKVCILNFAHAIIPGGGVTIGLEGQEESLCRSSTLYCGLEHEKVYKEFYKRHEEANLEWRSNDDCIYTPDVIVFKREDDTDYLPPEDWFTIDVISCSAPYIANLEFNEDYLRSIIYKRIQRVIELARSEGEDVLILGAFGCGRCSNPPKLVAEEMIKAVKEFMYSFEAIDFAVRSENNEISGNNEQNIYEVFRQIIEEDYLLQ